MNVGDRYYSKKYKANGTVIAINGDKVLVEWDKDRKIQSPPCWLDKKGRALKPYR